MNPYEEPQSNLEKPMGARAGIQWLTIALAVVIWLVTERIIRNTPFNSSFNPDRPQKFTWALFVDLIEIIGLYFAPWLAASIFLSMRVKHQWVLQGIIYSAALAIAVLVIDLTSDSTSVEPFRGAWAFFMITVAITMIVMATPRAIRTFVRPKKSP